MIMQMEADLHSFSLLLLSNLQYALMKKPRVVNISIPITSVPLPNRKELIATSIYNINSYQYSLDNILPLNWDVRVVRGMVEYIPSLKFQLHHPTLNLTVKVNKSTLCPSPIPSSYRAQAMLAAAELHMFD